LVDFYSKSNRLSISPIFTIIVIDIVTMPYAPTPAQSAGVGPPARVRAQSGEPALRMARVSPVSPSVRLPAQAQGWRCACDDGAPHAPRGHGQACAGPGVRSPHDSMPRVFALTEPAVSIGYTTMSTTHSFSVRSHSFL
jgi:hypothetical protein